MVVMRLWLLRSGEILEHTDFENTWIMSSSAQNGSPLNANERDFTVA